MTKDEALRLALETIKEDRAWLETDAPTEVWEKNNEAITAIEAALEAKDEPVGWAEHGVINWLADKQFNHTSFLYATPSQRTWVGLKDDEMQTTHWSPDFRAGAKWAEAKLKEKNT